ncbi:MAG TPA: hypothetical protein PLX03_01125 [Candidatus Hydrogenedentes bacterium]|nr:hypothetical protein [Candidatus Hydrogenedentota bacterium]
MSQENLHETPLRLFSRHRWWREVFLGITLFACGFLMGGVIVTKYYISRTASVAHAGVNHQQTIDRLQRMLDLNAEQTRQIQTIIAKGLDDLRSIRQSVRPEIDAVLERVRTEVSSLLNPRQKRIWERRFDLTRRRWFPPIPENTSGERGASSR